MTDRVAVTSFIAKHIKKTAKGHVDEEQLANAISEIELETSIEGASFIKVHLIDPYWTLATSGFLARDENGLLDKIQCEFPERSGYWWQLVAVELGNDLIQPNLVLVFEDRIVTWLREISGEKLAPVGTTTRAQFVKALLDEVGLKDHSKKIKPVIPSLNVLQAVESKNASTQEVLTNREATGLEDENGVLTPRSSASRHKQINKTPGLGAGASVTVGGSSITPAQREQANILLGVANAKGASQVATEALIFAGIAESKLTAIATANSAGCWGVLQAKTSNFPNSQDTKGMAESFLDGGKGFQGGGAIALSRTSHSPIEIAVRVEVPSIWPDNAYAREAGYEHFLAEAQAIIGGGGGVKGESGGESAIGQLARGSSQNPDENSFECIQRLAKQVRWFAFTDGQRFFYMDGFDFERQTPSAYLDIPGNTIQHGHTGKKVSGVILTGLLSNFDNTSFQYYATHKPRGKAIRKAKIAKPQTPSEIHFPLLCNPLEYRAGDMFVIQKSGPLNGRWVVTNTVRKYIEDPFTTFTLDLPEAPYPEPLASSTTGTAESPLGAIKSVIEAAKKAYSEKETYKYSEAADRANNGTLFGPSPRTMDCSSFAILSYKAARQPDPSGANYNPIGNTGTLIAHMVKTNQPQLGDLCFYGTNIAYPQHVTVYIGNGNAIGMERPGVNLLEGPVESLGPTPFLGYWRPGP